MNSRHDLPRILTWSRPAKRWAVVGLDVLLALLSTWLAFTLRLDQLHWPSGLQWALYALAPSLSIPVFIRFGLYRAIFRYTGMAAMLTTVKAVAVYAVLLGLSIIPLHAMSDEGMPRSMTVLQPLIFLLLVGGSRATARFWLAGLAGRHQRATQRLLIYGTGPAGVQTAAALAHTSPYALLGFIDDSGQQAGRTINGVDVYPPQDVPTVARRLGVTDILLAMPEATRERRNAIIASLDKLPVHVRTLPGLNDLASGRVTVQDIRDLDIEDLLGRPPVTPDTELLAHNIQGQVVLVTGAGGSIGSELCRQLLHNQPRCLLLLDHSEFSLYTIHEELQGLVRQQAWTVELIPLLGSVLNAHRMLEIFQTWQPTAVYHAAAYKHVPMVEYNPAEGVMNNVFGTLTVAWAAQHSGVARFVLISTDKAVRPTNLMGASKRVAELVLQALADSPTLPDFSGLIPWPDARNPQATPAPTPPPPQASSASALPTPALVPPGTTRRTCFGMVRFGNVLGSSGSVVPLFRKQLAAGGPLTVTHAEVTRYFMTIPEAVQLVRQAGAMAQGGEVFVLDMGEPVRIIDLARRMITLSGLSVLDDEHPDGDIEVAITGLRPGEKLYEELLIGDNPLPTSHPRIMRAHEELLPWPELRPHLLSLLHACQHNDVPTIKAEFRALVSGVQLADAVFDHLSVARQAAPAAA
jgi:FlaA1/EpsC-like NDP-sugar epimerase